MSATGPAIPYRRDIDGLRAVAILAVLLAHAEIPGFQGGFVGVDVFFVISGFLITGLVMGRIEAGSFSLVDFFERRASRLLPALVAMLLAVAGIGFVMLTPRELVLLGEDLTATALFGMNFQGWATAGYFGQEASTRVLLHAWSLGVEEQFYLVFPAGLWLAWIALRRLGQAHAHGLILAAVAMMVSGSLWLQQFLVNWPSSAAFYLLPPRMWELGTGALLALLAARGLIRQSHSAAVASVIAVLGLALIVWPTMMYGKGTIFPGFTAVPPVLGAAMLIWAGTVAPDNLVSRMLSIRPMVRIGLISYSLYLWHWPVLAFARLWAGRPLELVEAAGLATLSIALAALSWRLVEQPLRRRGPRARVGRRLAIALLACIPVIAIGQLFVWSNGLPGRVGDAVLRTDREGGAAADLLECVKHGPGDCRYSAHGNAKGTIVLWGDSHAGHFSPAVAVAMTERGYDVVLASARSCPPLPGIRLSILLEGGPIGQACMEFNQAMPDRLAQIDDLKLVILAGRWTSFLSPQWKDAEDRWLSMPDGRKADAPQSDDLMAEGILRAAAGPAGRGIPVILFDQVGEFHLSPRNCVARARMFDRGEGKCRERDDITSPERTRFHRLQDRVMAANPAISVFHAEQVMCSSSHCDPAPFGQLLYRDAHHLSVAGAQHFVKVVEPVLFEVLEPDRTGFSR